MNYIKVIGTFDDAAAANHAQAALIAANLANDGTMCTEPERMDIDLHPPDSNTPDHGRTLLIATVRDDLAADVRDVMAQGRYANPSAYRTRQRDALARDEREILRSPTGASRELD